MVYVGVNAPEVSLMFLLILLIASAFSSGGALAMRRSQDKGASAQGYLVFHFALSCLAATYLNGLYWTSDPISPRLASLGGAVGLLIVATNLLLFRTLGCGPPGLTFAYWNSGAVIPAILLAGIFGHTYGFLFTIGSAVGLACVIIGLYWGAKQEHSLPISSQWKALAVLCFLLQGLILATFQWRTLLYRADLPGHTLIPWQSLPSEDLWFIPGLFFVATLVQIGIFAFSHRRWFSRSEITYGILGGIANGTSTFLLLWATEIATPQERVVLFPLFAMAVIVFCNLWGQAIYKEHVNWKANALCCLGILIAALF